MTRSRGLRALGFTAVLVVTLVAGAFVGAWTARDDDFFALRKNFEIFGAAYEELVTDYVEPLDPERMMRTGLEAMLADLDPYTTFIDEASTTDISIITRGQYGGVGLNVGTRGGQITVVAPIEGASGYKQGVRAGDVLRSVDGKATDDLSLDDVQALMRGEPGTTVTLTVAREGEPEPLEFVLTRQQVTLDNVSYRGFLRGNDDLGEVQDVGYVKLDRFAREAASEVRQAVQDLQQERRLKGLVLDLRDNPGGLLDAAVDIASLFVPRGSVIVTTRGRLQETERVYRSERTPLAPDVPLVVLVNAYSASASEIVAGALQDLDRGVVMGTTTYGKGLVQVVRDLPHNTALKLTTAKYYTPSGRSIQSIDYARGDTVAVPDSLSRTFRTKAGRRVRDQHGIEPDVVQGVAAPSELEEALMRRAAFFFFANHYAAAHEALPAGFAADDATLGAFRAWLQAEAFDYRTDAERAVARLRKGLAENGYTETRDEVDDLMTALDEAKRDDFEEHAGDLRARLQTEIWARYLSQSEQVEAALRHDEEVRAAAALLADEARYTGILTP